MSTLKKAISPIRRNFRFLILAFLCLALAIGTFALQLLAQKNFHVVSAPGRIFRSGQMNAADLKFVAQTHGLGTILNLRGMDSGSWYQQETNAARELGIKHIDFTLDANRELTDEEMDQLLALIEVSPKPLLIHCKSGADRTGLVGALYLYSVEGRSAHSASQELTAWCGHIPYLFWRDTIAMDRSYWRYVGKHAQPVATVAGLPVAEAMLPAPGSVSVP